MENNVFEENYTKHIELVYGGKRDEKEDNKMMPVYLEDHDYAIDIDDRVDLNDHYSKQFEEKILAAGN